MIKKILHFFDKLEDKVRGRLSRFPIIYSFVGGIGVILFWRGVWRTADFVVDSYIFSSSIAAPSSDFAVQMVWWDGPLSFALGSFILLMVGLFVSNFVGNEIIISGLKGEKRLSEKTVDEIKTDTEISQRIMHEMGRANESLEKIRSYLEKRKL
ncbi:MAG: hypothetical protein AAB390_01675 [Patescibacteria group bacterium]